MHHMHSCGGLERRCEMAHAGEKYHIIHARTTADSGSSQLAFGTQGYALTMRKLHTVTFHIVNAKSRKISLDIQRATEIIKQGPPQLRRLIVNGMQWEVGGLYVLNQS